MVSIMTALWFAHLGGRRQGGRQAARLARLPRHQVPHRRARPLLPDHACATSAGSRPTRAAPRTPTSRDFSTGSVGLGAVAPLFAAAAAPLHRRPLRRRPAGRFIALSATPSSTRATCGRPSPTPASRGSATSRWSSTSTARASTGSSPRSAQPPAASSSPTPAGTWSRPSTAGSSRPPSPSPAATRSGTASTRCPTRHYQSLFALDGPALRDQASSPAPTRPCTSFAGECDDDELTAARHRPRRPRPRPCCIERSGPCDAEVDRPSVVFAYTVKGWGLPDRRPPAEPLGACSTPEQIDELRTSHRAHPRDGVGPLRPPTRPEGRLCAPVGRRRSTTRPPSPGPARRSPSVGHGAGHAGSDLHPGGVRPVLLARLADVDEVGAADRTTVPRRGVSTNLGGWINKIGRLLRTTQRRRPRRAGPAARLDPVTQRAALRARHLAR